MAGAAIAALTSLALAPHVAAAQHDDDVVALVSAAPTADRGVVHVVAAGEHLSGIAARYGLQGDDAWRRLFDANPDIDDPHWIEPGDRLRIPDPGEVLEERALPATGPAEGVSSTTSASGAGAATATGGVWDRLAQCESGGVWHLATGNGYYGGLQFSLSSWQAVGGAGYPHEHSRATQIAMAERLLARQGWGAWPSCSARLGLR